MDAEDDVGTGEAVLEPSVAPIFPLSRVKKIMKTDKDVSMVNADAVALTAMAAVRCAWARLAQLTRQEMFLEYFSDVLCKQATEDKRRTISYKDACTPFAGGR